MSSTYNSMTLFSGSVSASEALMKLRSEALYDDPKGDVDKG
jgi:hypothetical protein